MAILSIQSAVAYGHVGNSAALFPLQRLGFEVWPVNTVQFSNHTGYPGWRGQAMAPDAVAAVIEGISDRRVLSQCEAVLSGYIGDPELGAVVLDAVKRVKAANPEAVYCCDPVIGDQGRIFVRPGVPEFFRSGALRVADIATPNQFELEYLAGRTVTTLEEAIAAAADLRANGPSLVLITSLARAGASPATVEMLATTDHGAWLVATPSLPVELNGTGDLTAALFLAHWLKSRDPATALGNAASAIFAVIEATAAAGGGELRLVEAQDRLVAPARRFEAIRVG